MNLHETECLFGTFSRSKVKTVKTNNNCAQLQLMHYLKANLTAMTPCYVKESLSQN